MERPPLVETSIHRFISSIRSFVLVLIAAQASIALAGCNDRGTRIEGTVEWKRKPDSCAVELKAADGTRRNTQADGNGRFVFENTPPGKYDIMVTIDWAEERCAVLGQTDASGSRVEVNISATSSFNTSSGPVLSDSGHLMTCGKTK